MGTPARISMLPMANGALRTFVLFHPHGSFTGASGCESTLLGPRLFGVERNAHRRITPMRAVYRADASPGPAGRWLIAYLNENSRARRKN
jgi:hypothetical protein